MASLLELLRDTLQGHPPDPLRLDPELRPWALRAGMASMLCATFSGGDGAQRKPVTSINEWPELEGSRLRELLRSEILRATLSEVLDSTSQVLQRPPVLLKGAATSGEYYPEAHLRPMRDLDLLLDESDVTPFETALASLGYQQESANPADYYDDHHHVMPFLDTARDVWVEPHTGLFPSRSRLAHTSAFSRATWQGELRDSTFGSHQVRRFSPEYQLLHTACHWSQHLEPDGSLPGLMDMSLILRQHGETFDWSRLEDWLDDATVRAAAAPTLAFLEAHGLVDLGATPGAALLAKEVRRLGRTSVSLQHRMIGRFCFNGAPPTRWLNDNHRSVLWEALHRPGGPTKRLANSFWSVAFPPNVPNRYSPAFQLSRLRSALRSPPNS